MHLLKFRCLVHMSISFWIVDLNTNFYSEIVFAEEERRMKRTMRMMMRMMKGSHLGLGKIYCPTAY